MSTAHLFTSADGLVPKALRGLIAYNPALALDVGSHDRARVAVISGGGSGHEPAWAGYVGTNMLAAAVQGDIFASPSTKQILAGVAAVDSAAGTLLVITNYTGDCLHFGLAAETASAAGRPCRVLVCGDDVSAVANQIVSIAATLDHCHVPGRDAGHHGALAADELEIGTGPHNEPGYRKLKPAPPADELVATLLRHCLDETDADRAYVHFAPGDETALLVSNFGGLSRIAPVRVYAGYLETSLNAPAFSVSVINLTAAANDPAHTYTLADIKAFLDVRTSTHWETVAGSQAQAHRPPRAEQVVTKTDKNNKKEEEEEDEEDYKATAAAAAAAGHDIPGIAKGNSLEAGVRAAEAGAERTRTLTPRLGRATYVAAGKSASSGDLPPDPGAWGVMVALRGLYEGMNA
ncbi:Dak kinase [Niveomyces insectorum RCEF 264]|uniref:Dak kinase n=1 Tax=Niveomyces insectorum RCEF 264 TaxID=1081102 RepID=A0A167XNS1_9HYPO|nr:Dak kinase [Niveomyces insectorum RCEF 264]